MTKGDGYQEPFDGQLDELAATDAFLTELSHGVDPTDGADPIADLLLQLRDEVYAPMPAAPVIETAAESDTPAPHTIADNPDVIDLASRRNRGMGRIASGFIGAAAATLIIAGGGSAVLSAKEGSVLYPLQQQLFGATPSHKAVVELAGKLEEANNLTANGDVAGAQEILEQAQAMVNKLGAKEEAESVKKEPSTETQTSTVTITSERPVETVTTTVTVTTEPAPAVVAPVQTQTQSPSVAPVAPTPSAEPTTAPSPAPGDGLQLPEEYRN
ncbi:MAG: hypothetical protein Q4D85_12905 [Corynebacterium sp.]|uniref:hypothetical protein n=1 Tax=Corynebacterium sp. TaxID=1720 RepID=UPI0026DAE282|nr:hypothetical protein [Corynebacterium sp.]MDO5099632.1 hypothetical protein [Corynebacterium sp.]